MRYASQGAAQATCSQRHDVDVLECLIDTLDHTRTEAEATSVLETARGPVG